MQFDDKTASALLQGQKVTEWKLRTFVAKASDDDALVQSISSLVGELRSRVLAQDGEIALLKEALLKAELDIDSYALRQKKAEKYAWENMRKSMDNSAEIYRTLFP